jgi:lipid-A-disaccharide synthase-like uncharacterized protein
MMTQAEIETKLQSMSEQLSQLHQQQKSRDKSWLLIGVLSLFIGVGCVLTSGIIQLVTTANANSLALMGIPLIFLSLALFAGMKKLPGTVDSTSPRPDSV